MYQEDNKEDPKFEVGECVRISKYKNIFTKGNIPNLSGEDFAFKKIRILYRGHMLSVVLTVKNLV